MSSYWSLASLASGLNVTCSSGCSAFQSAMLLSSAVFRGSCPSTIVIGPRPSADAAVPSLPLEVSSPPSSDEQPARTSAVAAVAAIAALRIAFVFRTINNSPFEVEKHTSVTLVHRHRPLLWHAAPVKVGIPPILNRSSVECTDRSRERSSADPLPVGRPEDVHVLGVEAQVQPVALLRRIAPVAARDDLLHDPADIGPAVDVGLRAELLDH